MEASIIDEYVDMCQLLGGWTDWVQGPGGNCSIKSNGNLLVKRSGSLIGDTSMTRGWVCCDISGIQTALLNGKEDIAHTVLEGEGKPSIEAFFHCLPARIVVHLHPAPLLPVLCSDVPMNLTDHRVKTVEYFKPGIPLAMALEKAYDPEVRIYEMKQHGVLFLGETMDEIMTYMTAVSALFSGPSTNIPLVCSISDRMKSIIGKRYLMKPWFHVQVPRCTEYVPYTPDMAVFLPPPLMDSDLEFYIQTYGTLPTVAFLDGICYTFGQTLEQCVSVFEILYAHGCARGSALSETQVLELVTWDKEKERKVGSVAK
jgi:hypothetical protein